MAATKPVAGYGTSLSLGTTCTFAVVNVRDIGGPTMSRTVIDVSNVNTTDQVTTSEHVQGFKTFVPGMLDLGETRVNVAVPPDSVFPLHHPLYHGVLTDIVLSFPPSSGNTSLTAANFACGGFATGWEIGDPYEGEQTADLTIKWSGVPTFSAEA